MKNLFDLFLSLSHSSLLSTWSEVVLFLQSSCARARSIIYGQMKMEKKITEEKKEEEQVEEARCVVSL